MRQINENRIKLLLFFQSKICLFFMYLCIFGCVKTVNIKTDTVSGIKYIEPKICKIKKINIKKYSTEIINNKLTFNTRNLSIFIQNINEYKLSVKEFEMCHNANEKYYKSIISEIIK